MRITSPSLRTVASMIRAPLTYVPFDEPRSEISSRPSTGRTDAWRRETSESSTRMSTFSRPRTSGDVTSTRLPANGPSLNTSAG
jgi:hypothetical protein